MRNNRINSQLKQKDFTRAASRIYRDIFRYRASPALQLGEWNYNSPHKELSRYTCSKLHVYPQGLLQKNLRLQNHKTTHHNEGYPRVPAQCRREAAAQELFHALFCGRST